jgi:catechol 2,3-dioxygenase-like lactoylglutathione lyase family enzyme
MLVRAIDHLVLNVRDVEATAAWYQRVLGMTRRDSEPKDGKASRCSLFFGEQKLNVRPLTASKTDWFTADNATIGSADLCFLTEAEPNDVFAHLKSCGVPVEVGPVDKEGARGRLRSVYCRDPDGSLIEISSYS